MSSKKSKIGIIGIGSVGGAVKHWFREKKSPLFLYDKYKKVGSIQEINKADIIFICVPTPYHKKTGYDDSAILESLENLSGKKIVVIKSTILPGSTEKFQKKFPQHKIFFNPEFLREKYPYENFINPPLQLVGYANRQDKNLAKKILNLLPKAPYTKIVEAKSSELAKMAINSFLVLKVIFANQIYDLAEKMKINYEEVREILENEPRLGRTHFKVFYDGYRGFGGKCLPKDLSSLITLFKKYKLKPEPFETTEKINLRLLKKQNLIKKLKQGWLNNRG